MLNAPLSVPSQTTGPRAKPEEEKEDEVESRTFHWFPQVPLCHIVTFLLFCISHFIRKRPDTHKINPTHLWMSGNSPAVFNYWSTRPQEGVDVSPNSFLDPERRRLNRKGSPHGGQTAFSSSSNFQRVLFSSLNPLFVTEQLIV